jgi:Flp pilus assembly pilin Flp
METMTNFIHRLLNNRDGAAAVEYALLISCIALTALAGMKIFGGAVLSLFEEAKKLPF